MDKEFLVIRYLDLATQFSLMLGTSEPVDEEKKEIIKAEMYEIRELLGMEKINLG